MEEDLWTMYFDGQSERIWGRHPLGIAGNPISVKLDFEVTKNMEKYEGYIIGLQVTIEIGVKKLRVYGDFNLIINQISQKLKVRSTALTLYQA